MHHFLRYCIAGGAAAALHFAVLIFLVEVFAVVPTVASAAGFAMAVVVNYFFQYYWTFRAQGSHVTKLPIFATFALVCLIGNTSIFWFLNEPLGWPYMLCQVVATGAVVLVNFFLNRRFVFAESSA